MVALQPRVRQDEGVAIEPDIANAQILLTLKISCFLITSDCYGSQIGRKVLSEIVIEGVIVGDTAREPRRVIA